MSDHTPSEVQVNPSPSRSQRSRPERVPTRSRFQQARFRLDGISSSFDAERLERRLTRQVGVMGASVNAVTSCVDIAYDPAVTSPSLLARQMELSGYRVRTR